MKQCKTDHSKKALFWEKKDSYIKCNLCPHNCYIGLGKRGLCKTRTNEDNKLYAINYGKVVALSIDSIEKKPLYHFYPGSSVLSYSCWGCNLLCKFCQNWEISQRQIDVPFFPMEKIVEEGENTLGIAHTYTEPTVYYEYALDVAKKAHEKALKNVFVTNGFIKKKPLKKILPYIDAANIDLKSFDNDFYKNVCFGKLEPVLETIEIMNKKIWIEITNLLIPGLNDKKGVIKEMCEWVANLDDSIPLHFSAFHPSYKMKDKKSTPMKTLKMAKKIAEDAGLKYVYLGNTLADQNTYCYSCGELLVERGPMSVKRININDNYCPKCGEEQYFVF